MSEGTICGQDRMDATMKTKENTMDDFEDGTTKLDATDQTEEDVGTQVEDKGDGRKPEDNGTGRKPHRRALVIAGVATLAVVAGLGTAFATGAFAPKVATTDEATSTVEQAADEITDVLTPTDVADQTTDLAFAGTDVSVPATSTVSVTVTDGHVMVVETSTADAPTMVDGAARRCAALATSLDDAQVQDSVVAGSATTSTTSATPTDGSTSTSSSDKTDSTPVTDVTWVTTDPTGTVVVAVTDTPATAPTSGSSTADVINASGGHDMTDAAHDAIGGDASGIAKAGGTTPSKPDGTTIVPGTTVDTSAATPATDATATDAGAASAADSPVASAGSTASTTSTSGSGSGSSSGSSGSGDSTPSKTWVAEQGHWEPTYGSVYVQDSAAYDEQVCTGVVITFSDGYVCYDATTAAAYQDDHDASYSVSNTYKTVHHDATGHYEQQQTGQTWVVNVAGHWE